MHPYREAPLVVPPVKLRPKRPCPSCLVQEEPVRIRKGHMKWRGDGPYFYECEFCGDTWR
jgi:hypothetical protein